LLNFGKGDRVRVRRARCRRDPAVVEAYLGAEMAAEMVAAQEGRGRYGARAAGRGGTVVSAESRGTDAVELTKPAGEAVAAPRRKML